MPVRSTLAAIWIAAFAFACAETGPDAAGLPSAPANVTAEADVRSARVGWTAPPSDGGSPILRYVVEAIPGGPSQDVAGTSATVDGLENGKEYSFVVRAVNAVGTGEASAPSSPVTTPALPAAPGDVVAMAGERSATLSWAAPASDGGRPISTYSISVEPGAPGARIEVSGETATVTGLAAGTGYVFRVRAVTVVGEGPSSEPSNAVTPTGPVERLPAGSHVLSIVADVEDGISLPISGVSLTLLLPAGVSVATANPTTGELADGVLDVGARPSAARATAGRYAADASELTLVVASVPEGAWAGELASVRFEVAAGAGVSVDDLRGSLAEFKAVGVDPVSRSTVDLTAGVRLAAQVVGR